MQPPFLICRRTFVSKILKLYHIFDGLRRSIAYYGTDLCPSTRTLSSLLFALNPPRVRQLRANRQYPLTFLNLAPISTPPVINNHIISTNQSNILFHIIFNQHVGYNYIALTSQPNQEIQSQPDVISSLLIFKIKLFNVLKKSLQVKVSIKSKMIT